MLGDTTIVSVTSVPADATTGLPAFCKVEAVISPVAGSRMAVVEAVPAARDSVRLFLAR